MKTLRVLILAIVLIIITYGYIFIKGKTYTVEINNITNFPESVDELNIKIEQDGIVKLIDKKIENGTLKMTFESISEGKTYVDVDNVENYTVDVFFPLYVHKSGIITYSDFFGNCTGAMLIPISISISIAYIMFLLIQKYRENIKDSIYKYKNIAYLALIIFLSFWLISQISSLRYSQNVSLEYTIYDILSLTNCFSFVLLPIAFITSIFVTASNIVLIKKEGFSIKNLLGVILGILFCFTTIFPEILYRLLYSATWIDIHNQNSFGFYLYTFVETAIFICISYLECVLLGTIILGIKSAKHIPEFNKDYIIILGCKIKKDGTPTNLLKGRIDRAIEFAKMQKDKTGKDIVFVPSGGKGPDEVISEAECMKNYLLAQGIDGEKILVEDKSKNTFENIKFSSELIKGKMADAKIAFSTTNYHVFRAGVLANSQNIKAEGIGAKTRTYFWINAFIREFIATLSAERKKHFITILAILLLTIIMIILMYFAINL